MVFKDFSHQAHATGFFVLHNIVRGNKAEVEGELLHPDILS